MLARGAAFGSAIFWNWRSKWVRGWTVRIPKSGPTRCRSRAAPDGCTAWSKGRLVPESGAIALFGHVQNTPLSVKPLLSRIGQYRQSHKCRSHSRVGKPAEIDRIPACAVGRLVDSRHGESDRRFLLRFYSMSFRSPLWCSPLPMCRFKSSPDTL
jgi:hypothetical protein